MTIGADDMRGAGERFAFPNPPDFVLDIALGEDDIADESPDFVSDMSLREDHALKRDFFSPPARRRRVERRRAAAI